ncbi:hypothetical protein, partial [Pseudoclavibacter chungangensis]|uniref:hypothetical protein n=1 Tax=Pseudoclavibacter chungangensis TaxID=587635 RepID=UPI001CE41396
AFDAVEISDLSLNDNPTRDIHTLHRSDPRRTGVLLRRYDTTVRVRLETMGASVKTSAAIVNADHRTESSMNSAAADVAAAQSMRSPIDGAPAARDTSPPSINPIAIGTQTGVRCSTPSVIRSDV